MEEALRRESRRQHGASWSELTVNFNDKFYDFFF